jgi:glycosyltransferase involved in cell wall biosynthesis
MMHVLVVTQYFWPENFYLNEVVASLVKKGIKVDVLTGKPNYPEGKVFSGYSSWGIQRETWRGVSILRVPIFPRGQKKAWRLAFNYFSFVFSASIFGLWVLRNHKYSLIFSYGVSPILQAIPSIILGRGSKIIIWVQDLWPDSLKATKYVKNLTILNIVRSLVSWIYRHCDLILVQSKAFIPSIKLLAPDRQIEYFPNSVDPIFVSPVDDSLISPELSELYRDFSVVFAGNIGAAQGVEVIVEAASKLADYPKIKFIVIGYGSHWDWMNEQVEARGLNNLFLPGYFPLNDMPKLLQKADSLLVTLADEPIFALTIPNKIQAYMAVGKPILACLNGEGARVVADSGGGITIPAGSADELASAIVQLYSMKLEDRNSMGLLGRNYFMEHFEHEMLIAKLVGYFEILIGKESN